MKPLEQNFQFERLDDNLFRVFRHEPPEHLLEYTPEWEFNLWMYKNENVEFVNRLSYTLEELEEYIIKKYQPVHDSSTGLGNNTVTARSHNYNLFRETEHTIEEVKTIIKFQIKKFLKATNSKVLDDPVFDPHINCWFNVMTPGTQINQHTHNVTHPFISGHITVKAEDSYTYYVCPYTRDRLEIVNQPGEGIIFPSYIEHGTSVHQGEYNRISIAWDLYYKKEDTLPAIRNNVERIKL